MSNIIDASLVKRQSEDEWSYLWRIDGLIREGIFTNWASVCSTVNEQLFGSNTDMYKGESAYRKTVAAARKFYEAGVFLDNSDDTIKQLKEERDRLYAAKRELADQRREYNKKLVRDARSNNLSEYLLECANKMNEELPLLSVSSNNNSSDKEALLCFSDWHYGMVADNIWNKFNTTICRERVNETIEKTIEYLKLFNIKTLHVCVLGDLINGEIHTSSRVASEENTVDELIHVSEILAEGLCTLSSHVDNLLFYSTYGNHARVIQNYSDSLHEDNFERLIPFWLKARLQNNKKIKIVDSEYKEFTLIDILGYNIVCVHGDLDNIKEVALNVNTLFTKKFGKEISYVVGGDKHHLEEFDKAGIISVIVPSLCGCDEYANNKRLYSYPGQTLMIFNKDEGRECVRNIRLYK